MNHNLEHHEVTRGNLYKVRDTKFLVLDVDTIVRYYGRKIKVRHWVNYVDSNHDIHDELISSFKDWACSDNCTFIGSYQNKADEYDEWIINGGKPYLNIDKLLTI